MVCTVDAYKAIAYGLLLTQLALTIGVALFLPPVEGVLFQASVTSLNKTDVSITYSHVYVPIPALVASILAVCFSMSTMGNEEKGNFGGIDYCQEAMQGAGLWDQMFWAYFVASHSILILIASSPMDSYAFLSAIAFTGFFIARGLTPKGDTHTLVRESLNVLGYALGFVIAYVNVPNGNSLRLSCLCIMGLLDYMLAVGHTYDQATTMETVANCRMSYVCIFSFYLCMVYLFWFDNLRLP